MDQDHAHMLLRQSWAKATVDKPNLARLFYGRLFAIAPETEALFANDLDAQGRKLVATLDYIIDSLDDPDALLSAAGELAIRHVSYNVSADQYALVGTALLDTLQDILGGEFDEETKSIWAQTYQGLADHMIETAY